MNRQELLNALAEITEQYSNTSNLVAEIEQQKDKANNLSAEIQQQKDKANNLSAEIQQQKDKANNLSAEIEQQKDNANNLSAEIQQLRDNANQVIEEKTQQIDNLLPGATSAGLASSYHDARKNKRIWPYWTGFVLSLVALMSGYFYYLIWKGNIELEWKTIAIRTTIGLPLLWIAWYCQRSISQITRITEEYHHKQRVMSIYEGFSKQIDQSNTEQGQQQKEKLISTLIKVVERNPAQVLDPSGTFMDLLSKREKKNDIEN